MKTISKELAKKISNTRHGIYDTKKYCYIDVGPHYRRIPMGMMGTTAALNWDNWERLEVRERANNE